MRRSSVPLAAILLGVLSTRVTVAHHTDTFLAFLFHFFSEVLDAGVPLRNSLLWQVAPFSQRNASLSSRDALPWQDAPLRQRDAPLSKRNASLLQRNAPRILSRDAPLTRDATFPLCALLLAILHFNLLHLFHVPLFPPRPYDPGISFPSLLVFAPQFLRLDGSHTSLFLPFVVLATLIGFPCSCNNERVNFILHKRFSTNRQMVALIFDRVGH